MSRGILVVSHVHDLAHGILTLLKQAATNVPIEVCGGLSPTEIGTDIEYILTSIEALECDEIFAFYDLGSAKMNIEMAMEMIDKNIHLYDVALVEGSYTAAVLLEMNSELAMIEEQLAPLKIK